MFSWLKKISNKFVKKTTSINQEPLDRVSIGIIIILDLFVLFNVFSGLDSIARWPLTPTEQVPCYSAYASYHTDGRKGTFELNAITIENVIEKKQFSQNKLVEPEQKLGTVSSVCNQYLTLEKSLNTPENQNIKAQINSSRDNINRLENEIKTLRSQYDSTLLERLAGQTEDKSINQATADNIKEKIDFKQLEIRQIKLDIEAKQTNLIENSNANIFLTLLNDDSQYEGVKKAYQTANFWYPNKKLLLQGLFLLPLILVAYLWHGYAIKTNKKLQVLVTWHLLLIFCLPLVVKVFEFIQFGTLVKVFVDFITTILGGLLFLASYVYIVIIPLLGIGLIKFLQKFVFNPQIQAKKRIEKVRCINCNHKLRVTDEYCLNCGYCQFRECPNCLEKTYKFSNFCHKCGYIAEKD
jgi:archaellum component FlaC